MEALMAPTVGTKGFVEGHAHLYVNGEKIGRVYATDVHLPAKLFRGGVNQVTITLNNHGHMQWSRGTRKVLATLFIQPDGPKLIRHRFESFAVDNPDM